MFQYELPPSGQINSAEIEFRLLFIKKAASANKKGVVFHQDNVRSQTAKADRRELSEHSLQKS